MGKYLKFYKECMNNGKMPEVGLCLSFNEIPKELFLFKPTLQDFAKYHNDINIGLSSGVPLFWGSGSRDSEPYRFTSLRQTIVLFMAAMNNEL